MKNIKKIIVLTSIVGALGVAGIVYADAAKTPVDIAAALTGKTVSDVTKERAQGKTYGTIANEAGKLDEFKAQMLEQRKALLDQMVKDGKINKEKADEIYNAIKNNQATCDGKGSAKIGKNNGVSFGKGQGSCGIGNGLGKGSGKGMGRGIGRANGGCSGGGCGIN